MTDPPLPSHPPAFRRLCQEAIDRVASLVEADVPARGERLREIRRLLEEIHRQAETLDLRAPGFAAEQGLLVDAASALQSIDLDRGGPHVPRYVQRAVADLRRVQGG